MFGFHGRALHIDLSHDQHRYIDLPEKVLRRVLGGSGLGTWLLHEYAPVGVDPLAPEAPLIFCFSPLVGTPLTTSAKFAIVAKSPLTGMIGDSLSSSHFAVQGKKLGVDAIIIVGRAAQPSVLFNSELTPTKLWGQSAGATQEALADRGQVAAIGIAGENLVRYATISNDGRHAGRGGLGAVMGSKNLKAIVVKGQCNAPLAHPQQVIQIAGGLSKRSMGAATAKYRELGTAANLLAFNRLSALPTRNFQQSQFEHAAEISPEQMSTQRSKTRRSCASCTIGCEHIYGFGKKGKKVRLEYESLFALGPLLGIGDPDLVLAASERCDELGLDTISAGATLAFAMECSERGLITEGPRFGDPKVCDWLDKIATRQPGLPDLLADGSRRAAQSIGQGSLFFAPQVKGLEIPGYEPRALQMMALGFAVGTRGADHNKSGAYELDFSSEGQRLHGDPALAHKALEPEDRAALLDSLILCKFVRGAFDDLWQECSDMVHAITGWEMSAAELLAIAQRITHLKKAFNIREGWTPADDTLPERFLSEELPDGAGGLSRERLQAMVKAYNLARGWTASGYLRSETIVSLELANELPRE